MRLTTYAEAPICFLSKKNGAALFVNLFFSIKKASTGKIGDEN